MSGFDKTPLAHRIAIAGGVAAVPIVAGFAMIPYGNPYICLLLITGGIVLWAALLLALKGDLVG